MVDSKGGAMGERKSLLDMRQFVVKEHVGFLKLADVYDIIDPETQEVVGLAREVVSGFKKFLRLFISKQLMSTSVEVREGGEDGPLVLRITRGFSLFRSRVYVEDANGGQLGYFKSKILSLGGGFWVHDMEDNQFAEVKGDWKGWNFKFVSPSGEEIGVVTKKWAGIAKELFTSADTYMVSLDAKAADSRPATILMLAAALAIDIVFKERGD